MWPFPSYVLSLRAYPKIYPGIIEAITVDVIHNQTWAGGHDKSMQGDLQAVNASLGIRSA